LPEWLIERGIWETRAALVENGAIVEARIELEGAVRAGSIIAARLIGGGTAGRNAVARDDLGDEYLLPRGAPGVSEGAAVNIEITRAAIPGSERWKRPLARLSDEAPHDAPSLTGRELPLPDPGNEFGRAGWDDLIDEARSGLVQFDGGELRISPTAAMTLIDVDGYLEPEELAVRGAAEAAKAIRRMDIGGSIGIDLPTSRSKVARQAAAAAIDAHLPQPFERTAVNGFGFVQIVRPRNGASLIELAQDRSAFEARALLRRTACGPPGTKRIVAHPAVIAVLEAQPDWTEALSRQVGGQISLRADPALPMSGGYAESP
jgi:Ribonuclease G/E